VMLAYSFLVWLEYRQRTKQRRPGLSRPAFSPLPRRAPGVIAKRPPRDR
jgi:hypothetical protein